MPLSPRHRHRLLLAVLAVGAVYRAWHFWGASFWVDEFVTEWILRGDDLAEVTRRARYAYMPPLYFWLSAPFVKLFGVSAFAIRLPAVIFGVLGLLTLHRLVRVTCGERIALGAVAIAAAHPESLWYAQEARVYSFGMMVAPIAIEGAWSAARTGRRAPLLRYVLAAGTLAWAHNLFAPIVALLGAWLLWEARRNRTGQPWATMTARRWLAAHAAITALCAVPVWWALQTVAMHRIPEAPMARATIESLTDGLRLPELAVLLVAAVLGAMVWARLRPTTRPEPRPAVPGAAIALFAVILIGVPLLQTLVGAVLHRPFYMVRYRMPAAVLVAPLAAWLVLSLLPIRRPAAAMTLMAVLLHLTFPIRMLATLGQASYHQVDTEWDRVLARVDAELRPGTLVLFQNPLQEWVYVDEQIDRDLEGLLLSPVHSHYLRSTPTMGFALPPTRSGDRLERVIAARLRATGADRVLAVGWGPLPSLEDPEPGGPLDPDHGWVVRTERIWTATVYVAQRSDQVSTVADRASRHAARDQDMGPDRLILH